MIRTSSRNYGINTFRLNLDQNDDLGDMAGLAFKSKIFFGPPSVNRPVNHGTR